MKLLVLITAIMIAEVTSETADKYKDLILKVHNDYRRKQGGSNINKLVWSHELAKEADAWISQCDFKHQMAGRGENLAFNTQLDETADIEQAMQDWYDEIKDFNYAGKQCFPSSCHYTQVIWHSTREVGCALKRCSSLMAFGRSVSNALFFGCWYDPAGNNMSEFPYLRGPACSKCEAGQSCDNGLCA